MTLAAENLIIHAKIAGVPTNTITLYMFIGVTCTIWPSFFFVDPHGFLTYGSKDLQPYLILGIGLVFIVFQYTRSLAFQTSQDTSVVNLLCKTPEPFERIVFPIGSCLRRLRGGMSCRLRAGLRLLVGGEAARPAARVLLASWRAADLRRHSRRGLRKGAGGGDQEQARVRGRDAALADHAVVTREHGGQAPPEIPSACACRST